MKIEFTDTSTLPIDVGQDIGTLRVFWRYRYKVRFLVIQDSLGIEQEIKETELGELDTENPSLNERFISLLVEMLNGKSRKYQLELKHNVCASLNIRLKILNQAIRRYKRKRSKNDALLRDLTVYDGDRKGPCDKINQQIITDEFEDEFEDEFDYVRALVSSIRTVPESHRAHKIKRAYYILGARFGFGNADRMIEIFDSERKRQRL